MSWARRCRLKPSKKLAGTLKERFDAVVSGMANHRSNATLQSMNGLMQQAKRTARRCGTTRTFIAIIYLRPSRMKNLPPHLFAATTDE